MMSKVMVHRRTLLVTLSEGSSGIVACKQRSPEQDESLKDEVKLMYRVNHSGEGWTQD